MELPRQAQGFLVLVTYGVGMLLGAQISGWQFNAIVPDPKLLTAWQSFWWVPAGFAALVILFFGAGFDDRLPEKQEKVAPGESERHPTV